MDNILDALDNKETAVHAFLDIAEALENTFYRAIPHALEGRDVDSTITGCIGNVLSTNNKNRKRQASFRGALMVDELLGILTSSGTVW